MDICVVRVRLVRLWLVILDSLPNEISYLLE